MNGKVQVMTIASRHKHIRIYFKEGVRREVILQGKKDLKGKEGRCSDE